MNENIGAALQVEDITHKLSKGAQALLARRFTSIIREYDEERPVENTRKAKLIRWFKKQALRLAWKYIYLRPLGHVSAMFLRHYGLKGKLMARIYNKLDDWKHEIYLRCFSQAVYLGITVKNSEIEAGIRKLSDLIEFTLGPEVVVGSLSGAMTLELVPFDTGEKRSVVLAYLHTNRGFSSMVHELMRSPDGRKALDHYFIMQEGAYPKELENERR